MNIQALMKQAQVMQKNMVESKNKINAMTFEGVSELVIIKMNGKREVISAKIKEGVSLEKEDIEILEDMIVIATNDALKKIEKEINNKLGNQAGMLGALI